MKALVLGWCLLFLIYGSPIQAQATAPIDVFVTQDRETQQVSVYFTNGVTGLSAVAVIDNFPANQNILEIFQLAANGVIFRGTIDGLPRLITPNGNIVRLDFIPQRTQALLGVDWAISDDGRTIAWAEFFLQDNLWQANLYVSRLDGSNFRQLPMPPVPQSPDRRIDVVAVSNNGGRVFLDVQQPTSQRSSNDYFVDYQRIWAYIEQQQQYRPLATEAELNCLCPAHIANNGQTFVRLELPIVGRGFAVRVWNLEDNRNRTVPAQDTIFLQAGGIVSNEDGSLVLYSLGGIEGVQTNESPVFALVVVDMILGQQRIITAPDGAQLYARAIANRGQEAIVVDVQAGVTYKLDLENETFDLVADKVWLGRLNA